VLFATTFASTSLNDRALTLAWRGAKNFMSFDQIPSLLAQYQAETITVEDFQELRASRRAMARHIMSLPSSQLGAEFQGVLRLASNGRKRLGLEDLH